MVKKQNQSGGAVVGRAMCGMYDNRKAINSALGRNKPKAKKSTLNIKMGRPMKRKGTHPPKRDAKKANTPKGSKNDPNVTGGEQSFYSKADGKPVKKTLANVYKILSANTVKNCYEFSACNPMCPKHTMYNSNTY